MYHFTSREKRNLELGWETIEKRADYLGINFFLYETRPLIRTCLQPFQHPVYNVRSEGGYQPFKKSGYEVQQIFFSLLFKPLELPPSKWPSKNLVDFKEFTKLKFKPPKIKHYARGNKLGNSLLTKIRVGRSDFNQHKFTIGLPENPECSCHFNRNPLYIIS